MQAQELTEDLSDERNREVDGMLDGPAIHDNGAKHEDERVGWRK
jgi:hypothetical protein